VSLPDKIATVCCFLPFCEAEHTAQHNTVHSSVAGQWTQNISATHPGAESHKQGTCTFFFGWPGVRLGSVSLTCQVDSEHVATGEASVQLHAVRAWHEPNRAQLSLPNWPPGAKRTHDLLVEAMSFQPWRAVWRRLPDPWEPRTQVCLQVAAEQILNREWPRTVMPHMSHCRVACLR